MPSLGKHLRSVLGAAGALASAPTLLGPAYLLGMVWLAGRREGAADVDVGDPRSAAALVSFIERRFATEVAQMRIALVALAIAFGIVIGLAASGLVALRRRGVRPMFPWAFLESLLVVAVLHALVVLWSMADAPQLYAPHWYALGGPRRTVQVLATDVLGPTGVGIAGVVLLLVYVRPQPLAELVRRTFEIATRASTEGARPPAALLVLLGGAAMGSTSLGEWVPPAKASAGDAPPAPTASGAAPPSGRPNVILLAADSLRADRLDPHLAPNLSRLASKATRFDRAYVSLPRTFSSWVTILTGRHPHHHGIRSMFPTWDERAKDFDATPKRFARAGYSTAVVADYAGDIFGRIDLGFADIDTPTFDFSELVRERAVENQTPLLPILHSRIGRKLFPVMRERNGAADPALLAHDVDRALSSLGGSPFFLTVFFSTAHFPYAPPAPYYATYTDPAYRGRFKYGKPVGLGSELPPDEADVRQIRGLYDGAVTAVDAAIGRILGALTKRGLAENTILIVTADHGETLHEYGHGQGHGDHLFGDEATHVPLVIHDPRPTAGAGVGRHVTSIVRDVDIAPTLYELCGIDVPEDLDGASLAPALRGEPTGERLAYAETELWFTEEIPAVPSDMRMPYPGIFGLTEIDLGHHSEIVLRKDMAPITTMARHRMVRDERYKLVYVPTRQGVRYLLFDTLFDRDERIDVASARPDEVARLRAELWSWMLRDPNMEQRDGYLVPRERGAR